MKRRPSLVCQDKKCCNGAADESAFESVTIGCSSASKTTETRSVTRLRAQSRALGHCTPAFGQGDVGEEDTTHTAIPLTPLTQAQHDISGFPGYKQPGTRRPCGRLWIAPASVDRIGRSIMSGLHLRHVSTRRHDVPTIRSSILSPSGWTFSRHGDRKSVV